MSELFSEPALPKKTIERNKWTEREVEILMWMASEFTMKGKRVRWREIARETGHHESSCALKYHTIRGRAADLKLREEIDRKHAEAESRPVLKAPDPVRVPLKPRVQNPEFGFSTSTEKLRMDAELRSRIAEQGVTAGLLGDPPAGRSALDKIRAGLVEQLPPSNHREVYYASRPKITLASEPAR